MLPRALLVAGALAIVAALGYAAWTPCTMPSPDFQKLKRKRSP